MEGLYSNGFLCMLKILKRAGSSQEHYLLFICCSSEVCKSSSFFFRYSSFCCSASSSMDFLTHAFSSSIPSPVYVDIGIISLNSSIFAGLISSCSKCRKSENHRVSTKPKYCITTKPKESH